MSVYGNRLRLCMNCKFERCSSKERPCRGCAGTQIKPNFTPKSEEPNNDKILIGDITSGYRYVDTDEAARINAITNAEKERHEKALYRLKNKLNLVYGDSLDALRYATEVAKFFNFGIEKKEGDVMPTKYNQMFKGNLYYRFREEIKDVIFNNPATIIIWNDGTKTVVKCGEGEVYDPEKGMAMAIAKKFLGNNGNYYDTFKKYLGEYEKKNKPVPFKDIDETHEYKHERELSHYETVKDVAKRAGVSESTIRSQIRKGQFPGAIKQDGAWLIPVYL